MQLRHPSMEKVEKGVEEAVGVEAVAAEKDLKDAAAEEVMVQVVAIRRRTPVKYILATLLLPFGRSCHWNRKRHCLLFAKVRKRMVRLHPRNKMFQ